MTDIVEKVAMAICRVQLNGTDPSQPAARWNGTEIELQSFPVWRDFLDEARAAIAALEAEGYRKVGPDEAPDMNAEIERLRAMVRDAYNDGFSEGMREHTTRRGGVPWSDCKYRAMIAAKDE